MIVIPEKIVLLKVPKAASTSLARLFWDRYEMDPFTKLRTGVATSVRYRLKLAETGTQLPVLNGNWFFNRTADFGWHCSFAELQCLFGNQLKDYHWIGSVRHPVARLFSAFSFQVAKGRLPMQLTKTDFAKFVELVVTNHPSLSMQQRIHTWPQSVWLPPNGWDKSLSLVRQEHFIEDMIALVDRVPTFAAGLDSMADKKRFNHSFRGEPTRFFTRNLVETIEEYYRQDMARLGYQSWFESRGSVPRARLLKLDGHSKARLTPTS